MVALVLLAANALAAPPSPEQLASELLDGAQLQPAGLTLELPEWVEDGAFVPLTLQLEGATPPVRLAILRLAEPDPRIASAELADWQQPLRLSLRLRLPQSQAVEVIARDGAGRTWRTSQKVRVLGSSCLAPASSDPLARLGETRVWAEQADGLELRTLVRHPMETGRRAGADGRLLDERLLREIEIGDGQGVLLRLRPFEGMAANPLLRVVLPVHRQPLQMRWLDADGVQYRAHWPNP